MRVTYNGPDRKGWLHGATYDVQLRRIGPLQIHIGTVWSFNEKQSQASPTPIRLRSLRRFLEWFTTENV